MKPTRAWILYSLLRVGIFAVLLAVLVALGAAPWIAAIIAAIIGLCISYLFFSGLRDSVTASIAHRRISPPVDEDAEAESDLPDARPLDRPAPLDRSEGEGRA